MYSSPEQKIKISNIFGKNVLATFQAVDRRKQNFFSLSPYLLHTSLCGKLS